MSGGPLSGGLAPAEHAGDKQGTPDISGSDPQDRELQMPGAQQVAGQEPGQIDAVEAPRIGSVMRDTAADQRLAEEQQGGDSHEFQGRTLRVAYRQNRSACGHRFAAVPAEIVELSEGEKHGRGPAEQEYEAERAVDERIRSRGISGQRVVWEVVGVGMRSARTRSGRSPSCPGEEGAQLA